MNAELIFLIVLIVLITLLSLIYFIMWIMKTIYLKKQKQNNDKIETQKSDDVYEEERFFK